MPQYTQLLGTHNTRCSLPITPCILVLTMLPYRVIHTKCRVRSKAEIKRRNTKPTAEVEIFNRDFPRNETLNTRPGCILRRETDLSLHTLA